MNRDTIFISHATPEDNEFTVWIASRLQLLGYTVWIDKNNLLGGEKFWTDIEDAIIGNSIKFLLVYSNNICIKDEHHKIKAGIQCEINYANAVMTAHPELIDYFIILNIDGAPFDLFAGSGDLNQIAFNANWADGLGMLLKKLEKDNIPKLKDKVIDNAAHWYLEHYLVKNPIIKKKELYYTNWWNVNSLPERFYILRFSNERQAEAVFSNNPSVLLVRNANCISSFSRNLDMLVDADGEKIPITPDDIYELKISELMQGFSSERFPTHRDAENAFKKLFKRALHLYLREKQLTWYELASKDLAYYHTRLSMPSMKVDFTYPFSTKRKKKQMFGKYLDIGQWHYGVSVKPNLYPSLGFHLKGHLVFSGTGVKAIENKDLQHAYRRKKGRRMFNEEWRDLLLGFLNSLQNAEGIIKLDTNTETPIVMNSMVDTFWSDWGYYDPRDKERQSVLLDGQKEEDPKDE